MLTVPNSLKKWAVDSAAHKCDNLLDSAVAVYPLHVNQGCFDVTRGYKGGTIPQAPNHCGSAEWLPGAPKNSSIVTSTFFNAVHLLPKDLRFEHGGAKHASCPGRRLTSFRPCRGGQTFWLEGRIRDCLATWGSDRVRLAVVNAVALLSTVGNVALEKNLQGNWRVWLNWSAGRMRPAGRSLATADVDYEEKSSDNTHPCRSPTPSVNGRDLTFPTRTQISEQECCDLTASNRRSSTLYSRNTPQNFSLETRSYAFSRSRKHV